MDLIIRPNGVLQLLHNGKAFATAQRLPARKEWKIRCHAGAPWISMTSPKPTNVRFCESRREVHERLEALATAYPDGVI